VVFKSNFLSYPGTQLEEQELLLSSSKLLGEVNNNLPQPAGQALPQF